MNSRAFSDPYIASLISPECTFARYWGEGKCRRLKFDKSAVQNTFPELAKYAEVIITGELNDETKFEGSDTVRVK